MMKLKRILAFTMALTVLVSSHSFAYFEHLCTITQKKTLSFHLETCAGDFIEATPSEIPTLKKSVCCEIEFKVNKANSAVQLNYNIAFEAMAMEVVDFPAFKFEAFYGNLSQEPVLNYGDSSPPLYLPIYLLNEQFII